MHNTLKKQNLKGFAPADENELVKTMEDVKFFRTDILQLSCMHFPCHPANTCINASSGVLPCLKPGTENHQKTGV